MGEHADDPGERDGSGRGHISRRGFLGLAGAAATVSVGASELEDRLLNPELADVVLAESDLVGSESYVEWEVSPTRAPLPSYLREAVPSFAGRGAATGFVSDGTDGLPKYVESAVFAADGWASLTDATAEWVAGTHGDSPTVTLRESDGLAWQAPTGEGLVDSVRLDRVDDLVAFTIVGGRPAGLDPETATRRYGSAVRDRARMR